jgi:hypothetical protein
VAPLVAALFPAGDAGWAAARNHSPDLLLGRQPDGHAAVGARRAAPGDEHAESRFFHTLADDPAALAAARRRRHGRRPAGAVLPDSAPAIDSRRYPPLAVHLLDRYTYWSYGSDPGPPAGARWRPGDRATGPRHGRRAGRRAGRRRPAAAGAGAAGRVLSALAVNWFAVRGPADSAPRLVLDDLVIARRGWRLRPGDLPAGVATQRGYRTELVAARLAESGLPRHVFARSPLEPKPFLRGHRRRRCCCTPARVWRKLPADGVLTVEEMLPGPDERWLTDPTATATPPSCDSSRPTRRPARSGRSRPPDRGPR